MTHKLLQPAERQHMTRPVDLVRLFKALKADGLPVESIAPRKDGCLRINLTADIDAADTAKLMAAVNSYDPAREDAAEAGARAVWAADVAAVGDISAMLAEIAADESDLQTALLPAVRAILQRALAREEKQLRALSRIAEAMIKGSR